jgi:phosphate-selective porin OprO/OprP
MCLLTPCFERPVHAQTAQATELDRLRTRVARLEKELTEVRELLARVESSSQIDPTAPAASSTCLPEAQPTQATQERVDALDQQVRILDRRFELERERTAEAASTIPTVEAGRSGFSLKSPDGNFQLRLRGLVQADSRWYLEDETATVADTFLARRVRPIVQATLFKVVDFRVTPDFGDGRTVIQDAYVDLRVKPMLRVRGGKFKAPFGLERLASASDLMFIERGAPTAIAPNRDMGVMVWGETAASVFSYGLGVFDGVVDGGSTDIDDQDGKDGTGRVFLQPFARSTTRDRLLWLGFGLAASYGEVTGTLTAPNLATYRTTGNQVFFRYRADAVADGIRKRIAPQAYYFSGRLGLIVEQSNSWQEVRRGAAAPAEIPVHAMQVAASWMLTGERATYRALIPRRSFDPTKGTWGAFEVAGRYHHLTVSDGAFPVFADPNVAARSARLWTVGLNWYLNPAFKVVLDYEETRFEGGAPGGADRETGRDFFTRLQVTF